MAYGLGWIDLIQIAEKVTGVRMRDAELHQFVNDYFQELSSHIRTVYNLAAEAGEQAEPGEQRAAAALPGTRLGALHILSIQLRLVRGFKRDQ